MARSGPGERHRVRVWDLIEPADAGAFVADDPPLYRQHRTLPTPCRAVRISRPPCGSGLNRLAEASPCLHHLASERHELLAGPAAALEEALSPAADVLAAAAAEALRRFRDPVLALRFTDGTMLDLAERVRIMGVVNVTPDSFSDGGRFAEESSAIRHASELLGEGADLIDVGGESTRPGAAAVEAEEELWRVVPVIEGIRREHPRALISIDTRKVDVARAALDAGADLINDISALEDPAMTRLAAARGVPVILMHMRGRPETMQQDTRYDDLLGDLVEFLDERADRARTAGIPDDKIVIDPGIGFGKSAQGNEEILRQLGSLRTLGLPLLVGASRKSFVGLRTGVSEPGRRLVGSVAAAVSAALAGARLLRVHDVRATREALAMADAVRRWPEARGER